MFYLFVGCNHSPTEGWNSFLSQFEYLEGAQEAVKNLKSVDWDWWQIVDSTALKIVGEGLVVKK